jgi:hypothetical protein
MTGEGEHCLRKLEVSLRERSLSSVAKAFDNVEASFDRFFLSAGIHAREHMFEADACFSVTGRQFLLRNSRNSRARWIAAQLARST